MSGYLTKNEDIAIPGAASLTVRSLLDRQQFHDPHGTAMRLGISDAVWPLFGMLWPSGLQLAEIMAQQPTIAGQRILELGCGLGLASMVCHRQGADITASDCHPLAGQFLAENVRLNGLHLLKYRVGQWGAAASAERAQEETADFDLALNDAADFSHHATPYALEPQEQEVTGRYDLIIGSDLLYERDQQARLPDYMVAHATDQAQIWIIDPDRGNRAAFSRQMAERGYGVTETRLDRDATDTAPAYKGRWLVYARKDLLDA